MATDREGIGAVRQNKDSDCIRISNIMTHYEVLEIAESASKEEIKTAFRRLSKEYHPDRVPEHLSRLKREAEEKFKRLNMANQVLSDPAKRRHYDGLLIELKHTGYTLDGFRRVDRSPSPSSDGGPGTSKQKRIFSFRTVVVISLILAILWGWKYVLFPERRAIITINKNANDENDAISPRITDANISGEWRGFYTEEDTFSNKQIIAVNLRIQQNRRKITGVIIETRDNKTYTSNIHGTVRGRSLVIESRYGRLNTFVKYDGSIFESGNVAHGVWHAGNKTGDWRIERDQMQVSGSGKDDPSTEEAKTGIPAKQQVPAEKNAKSRGVISE